MSRRYDNEIENMATERHRNSFRTGMRVLGIGILAGAVLVVATKKVFDEIFVEDDWSDVDWGEDEAEDYEID